MTCAKDEGGGGEQPKAGQDPGKWQEPQAQPGGQTAVGQRWIEACTMNPTCGHVPEAGRVPGPLCTPMD